MKRRVKCHKCEYEGKETVEKWEEIDEHERFEIWEGWQCPVCFYENNSTVEIY